MAGKKIETRKDGESCSQGVPWLGNFADWKKWMKSPECKGTSKDAEKKMKLAAKKSAWEQFSENVRGGTDTACKEGKKGKNMIGVDKIGEFVHKASFGVIGPDSCDTKKKS